MLPNHIVIHACYIMLPSLTCILHVHACYVIIHLIFSCHDYTVNLQVPVGYAPGADAVPMAIKYIFDFLDDEAENYKIVDPDVVHT